MTYLFQCVVFALGIAILARRILRNFYWNNERSVAFHEEVERVGLPNHLLRSALNGACISVVFYVATWYASLEQLWGVLAILSGVLSVMMGIVGLIVRSGAFDEEPVPETVKEWQESDEYKSRMQPVRWHRAVPQGLPEVILAALWIYSWRHLWQG